MNNWQPWQWPTDDLSELRIERFSHPLDGKDVEWNALILPSDLPVSSHIWLQPVISYVWLRLGGSDELFCISSSNFYLDSVSSGKYVGAQKMQNICGRSIDENATARIYFLNASGELRQRNEEAKSYFLVRSTGRGAWRCWDKPGRIQYDSFRLFADGSLSDFMRRSALGVWQQYQQALSDPQSETFFAHSWYEKTEAEQEDTVWNWSRSEREKQRSEFEMLLRCVMWNQDSLWRGNTHWNLLVSGKAQTCLFVDDPQEENSIPDKLQNAITQLWSYFTPLNEEVFTHECVPRSTYAPYNLFHIEVNEPNQHESLEAKLRWRDWQAKHGQ